MVPVRGSGRQALVGHQSSRSRPDRGRSCRPAMWSGVGRRPLTERFSRCEVTIVVMAAGPEVMRRRSLKCLNFDTNPGGKDSLNNKVHLTRDVSFAMWALIAAGFLPFEHECVKIGQMESVRLRFQGRNAVENKMQRVIQLND